MTASAPAELVDRVARARLLDHRGRIVQAFGVTVWAKGLQVRIGQTCDIIDRASGLVIPAEVVGFGADGAILTPLAPMHGLTLDAEVVARQQQAEIRVGPGLLGRVVDAHLNPLDDLGPLENLPEWRSIYAEAPNPMQRRPINEVFATGVKAVDALATVGFGQRIGVFSAAGAGKSTILGMLARHCRSDINVVALIGERGREVREFIDDALGPDGLARSVIVVATADRPAMERVRAANVATAIAEHFRSRGDSVVLMMDSATRLARAMREVGLSIGELPVRRGFPPSVFAELPRLFERAGASSAGAITAFYTVLLEDEEGVDPVGEEVRALLDGHIYLSRKRAEAGLFPAIDVSASLSRLFLRLADTTHQQAAARVRALISKYEEIEFLLQIGEYKPGGDPLADDAIACREAIEGLLRQTPQEGFDFEKTLEQLAGAAQ